jgi:hypothetical protein
MVFLSRILNNPTNRRLNIIAGGALTVINVATFFVGMPTLAYAFITTVMIATGVAIVWSALKWVELPTTRPSQVPIIETLAPTESIETHPLT